MQKKQEVPLKITCLILFLSISSTNAVSSIDQTCGNETRKYCINSEPKESNDYGCLYNNFSKLSKNCKIWLTNKLKHKPCFKDSLKFCEGDEVNAQNALSCLQKEEPSLSKECKSWIIKARETGNKIESKVKLDCAAEWKICFNSDFRKQKNCMINLKNDKKMSDRCLKTFRNALKK